MSYQVVPKCALHEAIIELIKFNSESNLMVVRMVSDLLHRYWGEDRHSLDNIAFMINVMNVEKADTLKKAISIFSYYLPINKPVFEDSHYKMSNDKSRLHRVEIRDMLQQRLKDEWNSQADKMTALGRHKKKAITQKSLDEMTVNEVLEARSKGVKSVASAVKRGLKVGLTKQQIMDVVSLECSQAHEGEVSGFLQAMGA